MVSKSTTGASQRLVLNIDNCNSIFRIPSHLEKSYGEKLPSKVSLRVDDSGKKWKVSIEMFKNHYFFTDGWKEFAEQVDLKSLHFLKFKYGKDKKKKRSGDLKATNSILIEDKGEGSGDVIGTTSAILNENKDKCSRVKTTLSFSKEMKTHHRYRVDIPRSFILTKIQKDRKIRLKDGEGREWPVRVKPKVRDGILTMREGWGDFVIGNKVMLGSTVSFTWLSEDMLQTQIVGVGTDKQPLFSTKRNSGYKKGRLQDSHS